MNIAIVDYGMGNIKSIMSTLKYLGVFSSLTKDEEQLEKADKIILPGVGSFFQAMNAIRQFGLDSVLRRLAIEEQKPLLGICLGMQLIGLSSTEDGLSQGLCLVNGVVSRFDDGEIKVPHVGFNQINAAQDSRLYKGLPAQPDFYFTHSYRMLSEENIGQSTCSYGGDFVASFEFGNVAGVQFHPELSQKNGLQLLKNFISDF